MNRPLIVGIGALGTTIARSHMPVARVILIDPAMPAGRQPTPATDATLVLLIADLGLPRARAALARAVAALSESDAVMVALLCLPNGDPTGHIATQLAPLTARLDAHLLITPRPGHPVPADPSATVTAAVAAILDLIHPDQRGQADLEQLAAGFRGAGEVQCGSGEARGADALVHAAASAVRTLVAVGRDRGIPHRLVLRIAASSRCTAAQVNHAVAVVRQFFHPGVRLVAGLVVDDTLDDRARITLLASDYAPEVSAQHLRQLTAVPIDEAVLEAPLPKALSGGEARPEATWDEPETITP